MRISSEKIPRCIQHRPINKKSTLVQVIPWCCQATSHYRTQSWPRPMSPYFCSTPLLALRIGLYTASLVSLTDVLIGSSIWLWCTNPIVTYPNKHRECRAVANMTSVTNMTQQKAFPLPGTIALWVFWKSREFRGRGQSSARRHGTWNSLSTYSFLSISFQMLF